MIARTLGDASPETETRARRSAAFWLPPAPGTRGVGVGFTLKDPGSKCPLGPATSQMELTTKSTMVPMVTARAHVVRPGKPCKPRTARLRSGHYERQSSTAAFHSGISTRFATSDARRKTMWQNHYGLY